MARRRGRRRKAGSKGPTSTMGPARLSWGARFGVVLVGAAAAQWFPGLESRISDQVPVTYGAALGIAMAMRGKGDFTRFLGMGLAIGGGLLEASQELLASGPAFLSMAEGGKK